MHCMESLPYFYEQAWDLWYNRRWRAFCYSTFERLWKRHSPRPMPKAVFVSLVCSKAKMNHIYSSRDIETAWFFRLSHFFCTVFYFSCLCSIPYCSIIFTYASSSACNASPFAQKDRANIEIQNSITVLRILMIPYLYAFLSVSYTHLTLPTT